MCIVRPTRLTWNFIFFSLLFSRSLRASNSKVIRNDKTKSMFLGLSLCSTLIAMAELKNMRRKKANDLSDAIVCEEFVVKKINKFIRNAVAILCARRFVCQV